MVVVLQGPREGALARALVRVAIMPGSNSCMSSLLVMKDSTSKPKADTGPSAKPLLTQFTATVLYLSLSRIAGEFAGFRV